MKKAFLFLASTALLLAGCAKVEKEEIVPTPESGKRIVTLNADVDNSGTRVSVDESTGNYSWQAGEEISVLIDDQGGYLATSSAANVSGSTATFQVELEESETLGSYAFSPAAKEDNSPNPFYLDAHHTYAEGTTFMPMLGTISANKKSISFKAVGGVIKLTISNIPSNATSLEFLAKDTENQYVAISGVFSLSNDGNNDYISIEQEGALGAYIDFPGKWASTMAFFIPLPTGTYGGFELQFRDASNNDIAGAGKQVQFGGSGLPVRRSEVIIAPELNALMKGAEWSYTFESKQYSSNGTKTLNGKDWALAGDGNYWGYDDAKGQQFGSGSAPYKSLTLTSNFGQNYGVKDIVIKTSGASSINATVSVSVGGVALVCDGATSKPLTTSPTDYAFSAPNGNLLAGDIVISYSQASSKALYLKSINVNPDNRTPLDQVTNLSATQDGNSKNVIISWTGVDHAASYTVSVGDQSQTIQPASNNQYQQTFTVPSYGDYDVAVTANPESGYKASVATTTISVVEHVSLTVFVEGTSSSVVGEVGQLISELLPDDPNCSVTGYTFTGWSTTEYATAQTNEPTYVASTATLPANGMTVYAVFAKETQTQVPQSTVTYDSGDYDNRGTESSGSSFTITKSGVSISISKGYEDMTGGHVRLYQNCSIEFSTNRAISAIVFTCTGSGSSNGPANLKLATNNPGVYSTSNKTGTWTPPNNPNSSIKSLTFTATKQARTTSIAVTLKAETITTLGGWTTSPVAD